MRATARQRLVFDLRIPDSGTDGFWTTGSRIDLGFFTSPLVHPLFMYVSNSAPNREAQSTRDPIKTSYKVWVVSSGSNLCVNLCVLGGLGG